MQHMMMMDMNANLFAIIGMILGFSLIPKLNPSGKLSELLQEPRFIGMLVCLLLAMVCAFSMV